MKRLGAVLWVLALAAAYGLGARSSSSGEQASIPLASFAAAIDYRSPLLHSFEISRFLRNLDPHDLPDVLGVVEAAGFWFKEQDHHLLMAAWVPIDALAAMDWALSRPGTLGRRARNATVEEFASHDPLRALSLVTSIDPPELQESLQLYMVRGWARSNQKDGLTEYLSEQPVSVARQQAVTALVNEILKEGADAVIAWVDAVPDDASNAFKRTAFQRAAVAISHLEPARAAHWVDGHRGQGYVGRAAKLVLSNWAGQDPAAAMDWLASLPDGKGRAEHVASTFSSWLKDDVRAAEDWAESAAPASSVDPAVGVLVRRYSAPRPVRAMEWAQRIHDPAVRIRLLTFVGRAWLQKDRDAFMAWLPESGLESQVEEFILNTPMKD